MNQKESKNSILNLFLLSLFFFQIPPIYIIPQIQSPYLTTQSISRIIFFMAFFCVITNKLATGKKLLKIKGDKTFLFASFFFLSQSISIVNVINLTPFFSRYKEVVIGIISLYLFYNYRNSKKKIISILITGILLNLLFELISLIGNLNFIKNIEPYLYDKYWENLYKNIINGKLFSNSYDEFIIPYLLLIKFNNKIIKSKEIFLIINIFLLTTVTFSSNFRTRILMFIFALFFSMLQLKTQSKKLLRKIITVSFFSILLAQQISFLNSKYSIFDRLFIEDQIRDYETLSFRINQIKNAIYIGSNNIFGVGLGNYYEYLDSYDKNLETFLKLKIANFKMIGASEFLHNIFFSIYVESGLFGLISFISFIIYIAYTDIKIFKNDKRRYIDKSIIISFWTIFIHSLFNPSITATFYVNFWGLRGLLIRHHF